MKTCKEERVIELEEALRWALNAVYTLAHDPAQSTPSWVRCEQYENAETLLYERKI